MTPGNKSDMIPSNSGISWDKNLGKLTSSIDRKSWKKKVERKVGNIKVKNHNRENFRECLIYKWSSSRTKTIK